MRASLSALELLTAHRQLGGRWRDRPGPSPWVRRGGATCPSEEGLCFTLDLDQSDDGQEKEDEGMAYGVCIGVMTRMTEGTVQDVLRSCVHPPPHTLIHIHTI